MLLSQIAQARVCDQHLGCMACHDKVGPFVQAMHVFNYAGGMKPWIKAHLFGKGCWRSHSRNGEELRNGEDEAPGRSSAGHV